MAAIVWQEAAFSGLSTERLYSILAARVRVFVIEQDCPYQDLDGMDQISRHVWAEDATGAVLAYARITPPGSRFPEPSIGRVLTSAEARGTGLGRVLMQRAIELGERLYPGVDLRISAQQYLSEFYASLGFRFIRGPYEEDGIPHIEMLRSEQGER